MSSLDAPLYGRRVRQTPQQVTEARLEFSRVLGVPVPPWDKEIELYKQAGLAPPVK